MNDSDSRPLPPHPTPLCVRYQPLLALLRTDALSPREAATLTEHLSGCPCCQRELATYDALDAAARQHLSAVTFTPLTLEDIMQTAQTPTQNPPAANAAPIPTRDDVQRTARLRQAGRPPMSVLGPLAAVIALVLLAGLIFTTHGSGPTPGSGTPIPTIPTATPPTVSQQTAVLAETTWMLRVLFVGGHDQPIVASHPPTLRFQPQDDRSGDVLGNSGCNAYRDSYTLTGTTLHIGTGKYPVAGVGCIRQIMDQEAAYLGALPRIEQFHLEGDSLTLASGDGNTHLDFHAIHSAALAQSTWTLTQLVVNGHEQLLVPSHAPTLHFQPQDDLTGGIRGTGGCNSYSGSYTLTDTMLRISTLGTTNMACTANVMDEEYAYLGALPHVERYNLGGDTLMLGSADGSVRLTFHATR
ncbi:MAG TPA: META domain-containing protein [Ktedonobacterales bacterium]